MCWANVIALSDDVAQAVENEHSVANFQICRHGVGVVTVDGSVELPANFSGLEAYSLVSSDLSPSGGTSEWHSKRSTP